ncbi:MULTISPECIES: hypothetical protein [Legionella]|uniref:Uncharacterized protein n=1 Tax=Legionella drozanskii LLAP-1 TaxID=1212489 RepID=A0A0W0SVT9_9GAMM|nr:MULTISPECIES: hypothetical protein [Legionella]KTC87503.1 hypothetical protein Ldro_1122 [Legionella drozanskii LLAP-1]PJE10463.1 MAG: hypothetical protein CK430_10295 [Legionella sp.]
MLTREQIREIIEECRRIGVSGLENGRRATIPFIKIDILRSNLNFTGALGNSAIFINKNTYNMLSQYHSGWVANKTIAIKESLLLKPTIDIIGTIVHETGHAFNVAAKIANSEGNAYIFEIEVILKLLESGKLLSFDCDRQEVERYFQSRLTNYHMDTRNTYLATLVGQIVEEFGLQDDRKEQHDKKLTSSEETKERTSQAKVPSLRLLFFATPDNSQWKKENNLILSRVGY